jgi:hypothetical protein
MDQAIKVSSPIALVVLAVVGRVQGGLGDAGDEADARLPGQDWPNAGVLDPGTGRLCSSTPRAAREAGWR